MNAYEIAAIVGAGAWLPQIYKWLAKPKLKLVPGASIQIRYNTLGPVVNLTCALISKRKDAIVEKIYLEIKHKDGDTRKFTWTLLDEIAQQIRGGGLVAAEISKPQPVTALSITTRGSIEKFVSFQDLDYLKKLKPFTNELIGQHNYLIKQEGNVIDSLLSSKEFKKLEDFFEKGMYWREGEYKLFVYIKELSIKTPFCEKFKLYLTNNDIGVLQKNNGILLQQEVRAYFDKNAVYPNWFSINPEIEKI